MVIVRMTNESYISIAKKDTNGNRAAKGIVPLVDAWPSIPMFAPSEGLPEKLLVLYEDAWKAVQSGMSPSTTLGPIRACLEAAARDRTGSQNGKLIELIKKLRADGHVTADLESWAHKICILGNKALHEGSASADDVREAYAFLELLLELVDAVPAQIWRESLDEGVPKLAAPH